MTRQGSGQQSGQHEKADAMADPYDLHLSVRNPDGSETDFELVEASGAAPAENVVIDVTRDQGFQNRERIHAPGET
jgi:hypothetical protein